VRRRRNRDEEETIGTGRAVAAMYVAGSTALHSGDPRAVESRFGSL
jgi:hypothetical protein